jgi:hypothetical protein
MKDWVAADVEGPAQARRILSGLMPAQSLGEEAEKAVLLASELVTNASCMEMYAQAHPSESLWGAATRGGSESRSSSRGMPPRCCGTTSTPTQSGSKSCARPWIGGSSRVPLASLGLSWGVRTFASANRDIDGTTPKLVLAKIALL